MYVPFDQLPSHSRIWIYQTDRPFTDSEKLQLQSGLRALCDEWKAHGHPLVSSFQLPYNHFLVLGVDEAQAGASGCSIDFSVHFLKELQAATGLNFFNRQRIGFLENEKVTTIPQSELKARWMAKTLTPESITFNNLVATKADWESGWKVPVRQSWFAPQLGVAS